MCTFAAYYLQRGVINAAQCQDHRSAPLSYCPHLEEVLFVMMKCISHDLPCPQARSRECQADIQLPQDRSQIIPREGNFPPQPFTQLSDSDTGLSWWKPQGK